MPGARDHDGAAVRSDLTDNGSFAFGEVNITFAIHSKSVTVSLREYRDDAGRCDTRYPASLADVDIPFSVNGDYGLVAVTPGAAGNDITLTITV